LYDILPVPVRKEKRKKEVLKTGRKPNFVIRSSLMMIIHLGDPSPDPSSDLPGGSFLFGSQAGLPESHHI
jgi:hypothetical protein